MDAKQAWSNFARTGKVEDYIKYSQIKNQTGVPLTGAPDRRPAIVEIPESPESPEVQSVFPAEVQYADQDAGAYHPGADGGGERPSGHGADPR